VGGRDESEEGDGGEKGMQVPGCSLVEVNGVAWEFVAGDWSHEQMEEIQLAVRGMDEHVKSLGDDVFYKLN